MKIPKPHILKSRLYPKNHYHQLDDRVTYLIEKMFQLKMIHCQIVSLQDRVHDSSSYFIQTEKSKYILKEYKDNAIEGALAFESAVIQHLFNHQLPVVGPISTIHDTILVAWGQTLYTLSPFIQGYMYRDYFMLTGEKQSHIRQAGQFLGRMHACTDHVVLTGHKEWPSIEQRLPILESFLESVNAKGVEKSLTDAIEDMVKLWHELLEKRAVYDALPHCIVHEDFGPYNLIYQKGHLVGVIDFMDAHWDYRIKDLVYSLMMFTRTRHYPFQPELVQTFLDSYLSHIDVDEIEWEVMSDLFCLKRLNELPEFIEAYLEDGDGGFYLNMIWDFIKEIRWHQKYKSKLISIVKESTK